MKKFGICLIMISSIPVTLALSCLECREVECAAVSCTGTIVTDACGCCPECSKQKGEVCGGPWNIYGVCDPNKNLTCYKIAREGELEFNLKGSCQDISATSKCSFPYVFEECASACQPNCAELEPQICTLQCILDDCVCGPGYVRRSATNRTCVRREECDVSVGGSCTFPYVFEECASACQPSCDDLEPQICTLQCVLDQCVCGPGYVRRSATNNTCIRREECGRPRECEFPKLYSTCASACPPTCENPFPFICTKNCDLDPCVCPSGYLMRSLTDRRCLRDYECDDFSFCEKTCPPLDFSASTCELTEAWACELDNWKCTTYKWKMEVEKWWSECSTDVNLWEDFTPCTTRIDIRCQNVENTECDVDAFGCHICRCNDGKYEDFSQLMAVWIQTRETYQKVMEVYKKARDLCS